MRLCSMTQLGPAQQCGVARDSRHLPIQTANFHHDSHTPPQPRPDALPYRDAVLSRVWRMDDTLLLFTRTNEDKTSANVVYCRLLLNRLPPEGIACKNNACQAASNILTRTIHSREYSQFSSKQLLEKPYCVVCTDVGWHGELSLRSPGRP